MVISNPAIINDACLTLKNVTASQAMRQIIAFILWMSIGMQASARQLEPYLAISDPDSLEVYLDQQSLEGRERDSVLAVWHYEQSFVARDQADQEAQEYHLEQAQQISDRRYFMALLIRTKLEWAEQYRIKMDGSKSYELIQEAIELSRSSGNRKLEGIAYKNLGSTIEHVEADPVRAIEQLLVARGIFDELEDELELANLDLYVGILYSNDSDNENALIYFYNSLEYFREIGHVMQQIRLRINISLSLSRLHRYQEAYEQFTEIEKIIEPDMVLASAFFNINFGNLLIEMDRSDEALPRILEANRIFTSIDDLYGIGITKYHLGEIYYELGDYDQAISILEDVRDSINYFGIGGNESIHSDLGKAYAKSGRYAEAYDAVSTYAEMQDSSRRAQTKKEVGLLQKKYELSKKETENEKLRMDTEIKAAQLARQKDLNYSILILTILFAACAGFFFWSRRRTQRLNKTIAEQSQKLKAINEAKSQLFANISHDFRTPLTLISGQTHLLLDDYREILPEDALSRIQKISWNNNRLISLTEEIRELINLDSGNIKVETVPHDLRAFLILQVGLFQSAAEEKEIILETRFAEKSVWALIDVPKFEKIIFNLLSNALKFTNSGGEIIVTLLEKGGQAIISVQDSGIGIEQKHLIHVFDRYYQVDHKEYNIRQGLGIGLAICKELMDLHGGQISVQSELGVGTCFEIRLAVTLEHPDAVSEVAAADRMLSSELEKKRIQPVMDPSKSAVLVVDDHPQIRSYIADVLEEEYNIYVAGNGWEALELLRNQKISLIITDLMMPVMDGFVLITSLKKDASFKHIPIIVVSARSSISDREKALEMGVNDYLIKPFNAREFKLKVANTVQTQQSTEQLPEPLQNYNLEKLEQEWLTKLSNIITSCIDQRVTNQMLANELAVSERTLFRMMKDLTGLTPLEYVKQLKYQYARKLLTHGKVKSLNDAGKAIGISNVTRFRAQYKEYYDEEPSVKLS